VLLSSFGDARHFLEEFRKHGLAIAVLAERRFVNERLAIFKLTPPGPRGADMSAAPADGNGTRPPRRPPGGGSRSCSTIPRLSSSPCRWRLLAIGSELDPEVYEVVTIDGRLDPDAENTLLSHIDTALCLGVTVLTGAPISDALRISRAAKRARPNLPVIWGGWHPSMFSRECLLEASVDVTVRGQGEETFAEIVQRLAAGRSLEGCAGCTLRLPDGTIHENPPRPLAPVDKFRPHDYGLIPVERYFKLKGKRQLDYISSQGCNFRCAFCSDPFVYGRKWVGLEPTRMALRLKSCGINTILMTSISRTRPSSRGAIASRRWPIASSSPE
jgi:hypothetical protein